ncbi:EAL domain-containing protein [Sulfuriferula nivalis]|uniref:Diguanylate cyclase/phosphodiesterase n=1 Tax=Sulfuriferula nivalis TaxID=2675298 RepID=A0A809RCG1_9PROT|nr:EAL domain-containing protein [Sulfuriferula nivalis]BBO99334.1 hypothetical protein SFSGTM_00430 [Sulfuriferula nivalis]
MNTPPFVRWIPEAIHAYWQQSIRRQLMLGFSITSLIFILVAGYIQHGLQRDALYKEEMSSATALARALARSSSSWVLARDLAGLQEVVGDVSGTPDLKRAFILTREGQVLASTQINEINLYVNDTISLALLKSHPQMQVLVDRPNMLDVAVPVMVSNHHIGWVRVELTRESENKALSHLTQVWLSFALMAVLLVIFVAWMLTRGLLRELNHLMAVTSEVSRGDKEARASILNENEVGVLARDFNHMLDTIAHEKALLRGVIDATPDLIFFKDINGVYLGCNKAFELFAGRPENQLIGQTDFDFFDHETAEFFHDKDQLMMKSGHAVRNEEWVTYSDGHKVLLETLKIAYRGTDGKVLGLVGTSRDITERKENEIKIQRLSRFYAALSQGNQAIVHCANKDELFLQICQVAVQFAGLRLAWIGLVDHDSQMVHPVASFGIGANEYLNEIKVSIDADSPLGQGPTGIAIREKQAYWCQDFQHDPATASWHERGAHLGINASASLPLTQDGKVIGAFTIYASELNAFDEDVRRLLVEMTGDISYALDNLAREADRQQANEALKNNEQLLKSSLEILPVGVWIMNEKGEIIFGNPEGQKIWAGAHYVGIEQFGVYKGWWVSSGKLIEAHEWGAARAIEKGETSIEDEVEIECFDSTHKFILNSALPMTDSDGRRTGAIVVNQDITARKAAEERIQWLAHFDVLTGLPNRALFTERIDYAISVAQRAETQLAVLFLDLDHFKNINDTLGHLIGDELLIEMAKRLQSVVRDQDTVSRQGGDEFILLLPDVNVNGAAHVAEKLLSAVAQVCQIENHELVVTASIGIAIYPNDGESFAALSQSADVAMYRAKQEGRNGYSFYTPEMQARSVRNLQLENELRRALERKQLQVYYQPQVALEDGRILGAEALLRWQHPEFGAVSPAEFIPIAENSGLILSIGEWVLRTAMSQLKIWMDAGLPPMVVAVNLSAIQFRHHNLPDLVTQMLDEIQVPAQYLELELTEGVAMDDPEGAMAIMNDLHGRGIRMSIDDFGTGYSSLSYLKRFKVYKLKIDQSFVRNIVEDSEDRAIVSAIISLASSLGMQTIAEGVETGGQLAFLQEQGCDEIQGYYFSKPLPAEQFESFVREAQDNKRSF